LLHGDFFPYEALYMLIFYCYFKLLNFLRINIYYRRGYFTSCNFFDQHGSPLERINSDIRVSPSFIAERSICFQAMRSEEHTSELQSRENLVCRLLLEKKKKKK